MHPLQIIEKLSKALLTPEGRALMFILSGDEKETKERGSSLWAYICSKGKQEYGWLRVGLDNNWDKEAMLQTFLCEQAVG